MDEDSQRAAGVWAVFFLPFVVLTGFLYAQNQLTIEFVALYWFPPVVLIAIGTVPPPWKSVSS
jgi:hypothetical protein